MSAEDIDWQEIHKRLSARGAFKVKTYTQESRTGKKMTFSYIDARDVMDRLDEVVGPENWEDDYELLDPEHCIVKCRLTIHGVAKSGIGYPNNPGSDKEAEPAKAAESDALKRSAVKWGIGRFLYQAGESKHTVEDEPRRVVEPQRTTAAAEVSTAITPAGTGDAKEREQSLVTAIRNLAADIEEQTDTPRKDLADKWSAALKTNRAWMSEDEANLRRIFEWCQVYLTKNKKPAGSRQQGAHP